jgi:hypothetical protein
MTEKLTEELLNELLFTESLSVFINSELPEKSITLSEFLNKQLTDKGLKKSGVIRRSKLNPTFAYQIFSGERNASKNKLLQLSFAMDMDLRQTQRMLKIADAGELYCKNRREAIIIYCINNGLSLSDTDDTLFQFGEPTICEE